MHYLSIDYIIIGAFLLITLITGLRAGRGIKDIREYAIANKMFGTGALLLTFLATNVGGAGTFDLVNHVFANGISIIASLSGVAISLVLIALFVAPKVVCFDRCLTIGDVMGELYGKASGIITGVVGTLYSICMIGMELFVLGRLCEPLFGINSVYGIVIGGIILTLYTAHGGIKSVVITDEVQFIIAIAILPLIASIATNQVGSIEAVFTQVPAHKLDVLGHEQFSYYLTLFLVWSIFPVGLTSPAIFQRLLMAKHGHQLRNQYLIASFIDPMLQLTIMMTGLAAIVLYPHLEEAKVMPHIIKTLLPVGVRGLAMTAALAIILSTADSYLHTAGILLTRNVVSPLFSKRNNCSLSS